MEFKDFEQKCQLCGKDAAVFTTADASEGMRVHCPECGEYVLTKSLLDMWDELTKTEQEKLAESICRHNQNGLPMPTVNRQNYKWFFEK
jgi:DNA-directed RNA polymerase subunit RPC12/RpoP